MFFGTLYVEWILFGSCVAQVFFFLYRFELTVFFGCIFSKVPQTTLIQFISSKFIISPLHLLTIMIQGETSLVWWFCSKYFSATRVHNSVSKSEVLCCHVCYQWSNWILGYMLNLYELANHKRWYKEHLFSFVPFHWISKNNLFTCHMACVNLKWPTKLMSYSFLVSWKICEIS